MKLSKCFLLIIQSLFVLLSACSNDAGNSDNIYLHYQLTGSEEDSLVVLKLQFKRGGPNGRNMLFAGPGNVMLDDKVIMPDSSRIGGVYYEVISTVDSFKGTHTIVYIAPDGKKHREDFVFNPLQLKMPLPDTLQREDLEIVLEGVSDGDPVRIIATDSSFGELEINRLDTVKQGKIVIKKDEWEILVDGPIQLEFFADIDKPLENPPGKGGQLSIYYGFRRNLILVK